MGSALNKKIKKHWHWIAVTLFFLVLIIVVSDTSMFDSMRTKRDVRKLRVEIETYREQIEADSTFIQNMKNDAFLEKYARERFYMHSDDEDVYVIVE